MLMTCQTIGSPPISTSGLGIDGTCSWRRVPRPPHRITTSSMPSMAHDPRPFRGAGRALRGARARMPAQPGDACRAARRAPRADLDCAAMPGPSADIAAIVMPHYTRDVGASDAHLRQALDGLLAQTDPSWHLF